MASINYATREISCKIVYYGPGLSGKTTNLQIIHKKIPETSKSEMVSLATETDRTLFFDFLPLDLGQIKGFATKFQLYTVPGQVYYNATRKLVLRGVDGVVFVADSQRDKLAENLESLRNLQDNLKEYGIDLRTIPFVLQYNKRDLPGVLSVDELNAQINSFGVPTYEAQAHQGVGVFTTLKAIGKIVIDAFNAKYAARQSSRRPGSDPAATSVAQAPQPAPRPQSAPMPPFAPVAPPARPMPAPAAAHPGSASGTSLPPIARPAAPLAAPSPPPLPPLAPRPVAAPQMPPPPPQAPTIPLQPAYAPAAAPVAQTLPPPAPAPLPGLQPAPAPFLTGASTTPAAPAAPAPIPTASFLTGTTPAPTPATAASGVFSVPGLEHGVQSSAPAAPVSPAAPQATAGGNGSAAARKAKIDGVVDPKDLDAEIARYERELAEQQAARQNPIRQQPHANPNLESDYPTNNLSPFLSPDELNKFKTDDNFPTRKMPFGPGLGSQN